MHKCAYFTIFSPAEHYLNRQTPAITLSVDPSHYTLDRLIQTLLTFPQRKMRRTSAIHPAQTQQQGRIARERITQQVQNGGNVFARL
jgi:hypothetical protein